MSQYVEFYACELWQQKALFLPEGDADPSTQTN